MINPIKYILITLLLLIFCTGVSGKNRDSDPVIIGFNNMYYHLGALSISEKDNIFKIENAESAKWLQLSGFESRKLSDYNEIWVRIDLPDLKFSDKAISIRSYLNRFELYTDKKIAEHSKEAEGEQFRYYSSHIIPLPDSDTETVYLRVQYSFPANFGKIYTVLIGGRQDLYKDLINEQSDLFGDIFNEMFLGMILFIFGVISIFIFLMRFRNRDYPFLSFGSFSIYAGIMYLYGMRFQLLVDISPVTSLYIANLSFIFMLVSLFAFVEKVFATDKRIYVVRRIWQIHMLLAAVIAYLLYRNEYNESFLIIIMVISVIISFYIIASSKIEESLNLKTPFLIFFAILIVLGINQICESTFNYHLINNIVRVVFDVNWQRDVFGIGILGLTFALGYILIKHYTIMIRNMQRVSLELEKNKSEILKLSQAKLESQFEALKNQLNPHFLFNNFSTLISIIEESSETAVNFVQELANVYRYILKTRLSELVNLETELNFVKSYEYLMKQRFGENIRLTIDIEDKYLKYSIPPFSLQLLIENAVKHNIISKKKHLYIKIYEENNYVVVKNNLQKKNVIESSTNIGLSNIEKRYQYFTKRKIKIVPDEKEFTVKLPLLKRKEWITNENSHY